MDSGEAGEQDARWLALERDLYASLLELGREQELDPALRSALSLIVRACAAEQGYLEIGQRSDDGSLQKKWATTHYDCSDDELEAIRRRISQGIVRDTLERGQLLSTVSAALDARFQDNPSVRRNKIEAVICAPIGESNPFGVLYLQGKSGAGPLPERARPLVELFARHAEPVLKRLARQQFERESDDPTQPWRTKLEVDDLVGRSKQLARVLADVDLVASRTVPVLIVGENGTGKTAVARAIHANGPRRDAPFVHVNLGALNEGLLESQLFGAEQGSYTGATQSREGFVGAARGGTLFLDEVTEFSSNCQTRLLQLLQEAIYYPVGSSQPIKADVRVISATNADLDQRIKDGTFRQDLYYRICGVKLRVPSLRERRGDLGELVTHLCERESRKLEATMIYPSPAAFELLVTRDWPGNVRELEHKIREGVLRAEREAASQIEVRHLFPRESGEGKPDAVTWSVATRDFQRSYLQQVLEHHSWNVTQASKQLDLSRAHVYNLLREFDLQRPT